MAMLKDTVIAGSLRVTDTTYTTNLNLSSLTASKAVVADANKNIITEDLSVSAPSASGNATAFITSVSQGATGKISVSKANLDTSGTWSGTATKATTTADTSSSLYLVGVASGATSTLKHTTGATVKNGAISATTYNGLTLTAATTGFTIAGGTTSKTLTVGNSYTLGAACAYAVDDATANGALGTGTGLTTERSVYYGLVTVNNASQTRATGIYAPTSAGTANQILVSSGGTSAPTWKATAAGAAYATAANGALTFGTLGVSYGGTNLTSITQGGILYAASTTAYGCTAAGTAGQLIMSGGTSAPSWTDGLTYSKTTASDLSTYNITIGSNSSAHIRVTESSTGVDGQSILMLGNSTASGTANNSYGRIQMYNSASGYHYIQTSGSETGTSFYTHTLPTNDGVLVTTNNTSGAVGSSTKPVYVSANGVLAEGGDLSQLVIIKSYTSTKINSWASGAEKSYYGSTQSDAQTYPYFTLSTPTGYRAIGIGAITPNKTSINIKYFSGLTTGAGVVRAQNTSSSTLTDVTITITIIYVKSGYSAVV